MLRCQSLSSLALLVVLLLFAAAQVSLAANYYVSPTGLDTNAGTSARPFKTINHAITRLAAGDTLLLKPGTYTELVGLEPLENIPNVKIQAVNTRTAIIDGANLDGIALGSTLPVRGLKLIGLKIINGGNFALHLANAIDVCILDCEISDSYRSLWIVNGSNVLVRRTYVHNNLKGFIFGFGAAALTGLTIEDCVAENNCWGELEGDADGFLVESSCSNVTISRCTATGHGDSGFDIKPADVRLDRCAAYNNWESGFKLWRDGVFLTNSRACNNEGFGIVAAGNNLRFWNLTIANQRHYGLQLEATDPTTVEIRNCIFYYNPIWVKKDQMYQDNNNVYWIGGIKWMILVGYQRGWRINQLTPGTFPLGSRSMACNPRFVSSTTGDYHLMGTSPCLAKGAWGSFLLLDLDGCRRSAPPDVGCYKYVAPPT